MRRATACHEQGAAYVRSVPSGQQEASCLRQRLEQSEEMLAESRHRFPRIRHLIQPRRRSSE